MINFHYPQWTHLCFGMHALIKNIYSFTYKNMNKNVYMTFFFIPSPSDMECLKRSSNLTEETEAN